MAIKSMTGFGRAEGALGAWRWHWEIKSVNARGLDARLRLPPGLEALEPRLRETLQQTFKRGACQVSLSLEREGAAAELRVNEETASRLMGELDSLAKKVGSPSPTLESVLGIRGVIEVMELEVSEDDETARQDALAISFNEAAKSLAAARDAEGRKLQTILEGVIAEIEKLTDEAAALAATAPETLRARLEAQVSELLADRTDVPPERIAQEVAMLAAKADVREELDRLRAHIAQARELFADKGAVGRKLDFLSQEFNREANTLCSKSSDTELTRIGLDLKAAIDQLREQVQNVE